MRKASAVVLGLVLCAVLPALASGQGVRPKKVPNEISMEELADPLVSSLNVLDAVQRLRPNWMRSRGETSLSEFGMGASMPAGAAGCGARGQSTNCSAVSTTPGSNAPGVILNDVRQEFEILRSIKAREVTSLKYLSAQDATTLYGTGFHQGAVVVSTAAVER